MKPPFLIFCLIFSLLLAVPATYAQTTNPQTFTFITGGNPTQPKPVKWELEFAPMHLPFMDPTEENCEDVRQRAEKLDRSINERFANFEELSDEEIDQLLNDIVAFAAYIRFLDRC